MPILHYIYLSNKWQLNSKASRSALPNLNYLGNYSAPPTVQPATAPFVFKILKTKKLKRPLPQNISLKIDFVAVWTRIREEKWKLVIKTPLMDLVSVKIWHLDWVKCILKWVKWRLKAWILDFMGIPNPWRILNPWVNLLEVRGAFDLPFLVAVKICQNFVPFYLIVSVVSEAKVEKKLNWMAQSDLAIRNPSLCNFSVLSCGKKQLENHTKLDCSWQNLEWSFISFEILL